MISTVKGESIVADENDRKSPNADDDHRGNHGEKNTISLGRFDVLRFKTKSTHIAVELVSGTAEIFGTELIQGHLCAFMPNMTGSIFTTEGATIRVHSFPSEKKILTSAVPLDTVFDYFLMQEQKGEEDIERDLPRVYLNIHACLENLRLQSIAKNDRGPRILICGFESTGKATLSRVLANYAARSGRKCFLVDLNSTLNKIGVPGSLVAQVVSKPYDLYEGWSSQDDPVIYSYGHVDPTENIDLLQHLMQQLSDTVNIQCEGDVYLNNCGAIINMCSLQRDSQTPAGASGGGSTAGGPMESGSTNKAKVEGKEDTSRQLIVQAAHIFDVDVVLVIEDKKTNDVLRRELSNEVSVICIPKSPGVIPRNQDQVIRLRDERFTAYYRGEAYQLHACRDLLNSAINNGQGDSGTAMKPNPFGGMGNGIPGYGNSSTIAGSVIGTIPSLQPHKVTWLQKHFEVISLGREALPDALLPHGESGEPDAWKKIEVQSATDRSHLNRVFAISQAEEMEDTLNAPVFGFVTLISADKAKGTAAFLSPSFTTQPPGRYFMATDFLYNDMLKE